MRIKLISSLSAILVLGACGRGLNQALSADSTKPMTAQVLYRGNRCAATKLGVHIIRDAASWAEWKRQQQTLFSASGEEENRAADLEFSQVSIIVISMGQQPTPGYAIEVPEGSVTLRGTSLAISTIWKQPPEDAILAQMLTSPCIAFTIPTTQYTTVEIKDQDGNTIIDQQALPETTTLG